jgi:hypothetical protein
MRTNKQANISVAARELSLLGLQPKATSRLANCLLSGLGAEVVGHIIPCRVVGNEMVLYGEVTVVWDRVLGEIDTIVRRAA